MVKLLFVLMNEYRLWALPQALAALERRYPGAVEGRVYSVREINADAGLERALLADGAAADMAFLASHGSIQNLYCFSRLWEALEGRPVYFTSTMGDELAELLPRLGLEPALYAALDSYYQAGSPGDLEGLVLCALNGRFGGDYPLSPPSPPRGQGVYTPVSYTHLDVYKRQVLACFGHVQALRRLNGYFQFRFCLRLSLAQHVLVNDPARLRVAPGGVPALPATVLLFAEVALPVCSAFCHGFDPSFAATQHTAEGGK